MKKLKTLQDIVSSKDFAKELKLSLSRYDNRPLPAAGLKYVRTGYDGLHAAGRLNVEFFLKETVLISEKRSTLPKAQRDVIEYEIAKAIQAVMKMWTLKDAAKMAKKEQAFNEQEV